MGLKVALYLLHVLGSRYAVESLTGSDRPT